MEWRRSLPDAPGLWWWREWLESTGDVEYGVTRVKIAPNETVVCWQERRNGWYDVCDVYGSDCEWYGPVEPPR